MSDAVRVRLAESPNAVIVARLQQAMDRELGAVDRFAAVWLADLNRRRTWLAERDGRAIGVLVLVDNLPRPGQPPQALGPRLAGLR